MPKDVCSIELPEAGTTQVINLTPGQVNTLSFSKDTIIGDPILSSEGSVKMNLINGSTVVIDNFQELADSAQSCGRDTIIQLSDNTIIYPEELYTQLVAMNASEDVNEFAAIAPAAGSDEQDFGIQKVEIPTNGSEELTVQAGQEYQFGFDLSDVQSMTQDGQSLILNFGNGQSITFNEFFTAANGALPPVISLSDGSVIDASSLLPTFLASRGSSESDSSDLASLSPEGVVVETASEIEPASGEENTPTENTLEVVEATVIEAEPTQENLEVQPALPEEIQALEEGAAPSSTNQNPVDLANVAEAISID